MCGPTWNSGSADFAFPAMLGTHAPAYMYAIPTVVMWGSRAARLSFTHCMKTGSKQPGSP